MRNLFFTFLVLMLAAAAQAVVLYEDDFDGLLADPLNGTTPDVGTDTWTATESSPLVLGDPRADGSFQDTSVERTAYLPIQIQNGRIYTLKVDCKVTNPTNPDWWAAFAFQNTASLPDRNPNYGSWATLLLRGNGGTQFITVGGSPAVTGPTGTTGAFNELKIVIDTTGTPWTADAYLNGTAFATDRALGASVQGAYRVAIGKAQNVEAVFDDLRVDDSPDPVEKPDGFDPADGETFVDLEPSLTWVRDALADPGIFYKVYFGTNPVIADPNFGLPLVKTTTSDPADFFYDTPTLNYGTEYAWVVVPYEPNTPNPVRLTEAELTEPLLFTTKPFIEGQPADLVVKAGQTAQFSVFAPDAASWQWYRSGDTNPLSDAGKYSGTATDTLMITDVQLAEEGFYYCLVDNDTSDSAQLLTTRLVGWWKLDNDDPNDSIQDLYPTAPKFDGQSAGDPNYVPGRDGDAIEFYGNNPDDLVNMSGSTEYYNFYPQGYTVSAWVKAPPADDWRAFVSKELCWNQTRAANFWGYALYNNDLGNAVFTQRRSVGNLDSGVQIADNTWHLVTGTWNPSDMKARVYVDGILRNTSGEASSPPVPNPNNPELFIVRIGADADRYENELGQNSPFIGLVDDVRIYSYPLNDREVAFLYNSFDICDAIPDFDVSGPDGLPDCKVNLYDWAEFAAAWLNGYEIDELQAIAEEWLDCGLFNQGLCNN